MRSLRTMPFLILASALAAAGAQQQKDQELFNQAKILMFDKDWDEARSIYEQILREFPSSSVVPQAFYFRARCLQLQGKHSDALQAYESFIRDYPRQPYLQSEAQNAVLDLAATLMERGDEKYRDRLVTGLKNSEREVRYYAALRSSYLQDSVLRSLAVPVLRQILQTETKRDLVDRAKIALLKLDPASLPPTDQKSGVRSESQDSTRMFHLQIFEKDAKDPIVELNLPLSFAQLALSALPQVKKDELKRYGIDADNLFEGLKALKSQQILTLRDNGNLVRIWIR